MHILQSLYAVHTISSLKSLHRRYQRSLLHLTLKMTADKQNPSTFKPRNKKQAVVEVYSPILQQNCINANPNSVLHICPNNELKTTQHTGNSFVHVWFGSYCVCFLV